MSLVVKACTHYPNLRSELWVARVAECVSIGSSRRSTLDALRTHLDTHMAYAKELIDIELRRA